MQARPLLGLGNPVRATATSHIDGVLNARQRNSRECAQNRPTTSLDSSDEEWTYIEEHPSLSEVTMTMSELSMRYSSLQRSASAPSFGPTVTHPDDESQTSTTMSEDAEVNDMIRSAHFPENDALPMIIHDVLQSPDVMLAVQEALRSSAVVQEIMNRGRPALPYAARPLLTGGPSDQRRREAHNPIEKFLMSVITAIGDGLALFGELVGHFLRDFADNLKIVIEGFKNGGGRRSDEDTQLWESALIKVAVTVGVVILCRRAAFA